jgi:DNA-directed DNA polymerase III PolC
MALIPLHTRSRHSLGYGTAAVEELARRAAALGLPALGLTDIETLSAQIRFHDACADTGIKPVTGVELRAGFGRRSIGHRSGRLILLARDQVGYQSLCRIVSRRRAALRTDDVGDPVSSLLDGADGLFVLTDDGQVLERLLRMETIARDDVRLLLVRPGRADGESAVRELSARTRVPLVADLDALLLDVADHALHTLLSAMRHKLTTVETARAGLAESAARTLTDRRAEFADVPGAVAEAGRLADACTLDLRNIRAVPPRLPDVDSAEAIALLRSRCTTALAAGRAAGRFAGEPYDTRLERELHIIERLGFVDYFVAVAEIVRGARSLGIATAGRGSAAGSLVAHLLDITDIDPISSDLLFERFLHEKREAPPDIDLDVESDRRDDLNAWVLRRFGRERVAGIATYATYRARTAVREGLAAIGIARRTIDLVLARVDPGEASGEEEAALVAEALAASPIPAVRDAAPLIRRLVGMPAYLAAHPGGIVIGDRPVENLAPLERSPRGTIVTQYDLRAVERAGFLKIDLLGNHFLSEMREALDNLPLRVTIPDDDAETWDTIGRADTIGCFQIESPAVRAVLRRLPVRSFRELVAALAVVRPGAAAGASKERYVRRARGEEEFEPLEILGSVDMDERYNGLRQRLTQTLGVLLYDEDIIRLLAIVGATDYATADALRSAIVAAGEVPEILARLGAAFVQSAGEDKKLAGQAWEVASRFAAYSFAEAHAASYALLAWRAAWLRTHAPLAFGCALINHHRGLYPLRTTAAAVNRWGVKLLTPSVNRSAVAAIIERAPEEGVRVGLAAIKGLTQRTARDLLKGRPFRDLEQLIARARPSKVELRALLLSGACDALPPLSAAAYPFVHEVVLKGTEGEAVPQSLHDVVGRFSQIPRQGPEMGELRVYQALIRVRNEIEYLDMHLSAHPMRLLRAEANRVGCVRSGEVAAHTGRFVRFAGLLAAARRVPTRQGELRFLTLEDEDGLLEAVIFPGANARLAGGLTTPGPFLAGGVVRDQEGDVILVLTELRPFHERP